MVIGMRLGRPAVAGELLDRAEYLARSLGRDREAADVLFARVVKMLHASGEPPDVVRAIAAKARTLSAERGAHPFAHRAESFLAGLQ